MGGHLQRGAALRWRSLSTWLVTAAGLLGTASGTPVNWASYNRTLTGERYSELKEINTGNVAGLSVICTYDTGARLSFESGPIEIAGHLIATTDTDTFALDPESCREQWRVHEDLAAAGGPRVNRGVAYEDGRIFRGTLDGRVLAYDAKTGQRIWERRIGHPESGETVPAAPLVWNGHVFIGTAGGDLKGNKGRMYALAAADGRVVWEFYLVPKDAEEAHKLGWQNPPDVPVSGGATWSSYTLDPLEGLLYVPVGNPGPVFDARLRPGPNPYTGSIVVLDARTGAYARHFNIVPGDFHDWDVSTAPVVIANKGRHLLAAAGKDGYLHVFDLTSGSKLYDTPVTRIENAAAPFSERPTRFCPGTQGGSEWNGPAYDPQSNLLFTGSIEWCATVTLQPLERTRSARGSGQAWTGQQSTRSRDLYGKLDPAAASAGWVYAVNADTGEVVWRFKTPRPLLGAITPTAGGLLLAGDMQGTLYAFDSHSGAKLFSQRLPGAIGGGLITYDAGGGQRIAVAAGMTSPIWPTQDATAKIVVLALKPPPLRTASAPSF